MGEIIPFPQHRFDEKLFHEVAVADAAIDRAVLAIDRDDPAHALGVIAGEAVRKLALAASPERAHELAAWIERLGFGPNS